MFSIFDAFFLLLLFLEIVDLPPDSFKKVALMFDLFLNGMKEVVVVLRHVDLMLNLFAGGGGGEGGGWRTMMLRGEVLLQFGFDRVFIRLFQHTRRDFYCIVIIVPWGE